MPYSYLCSSTMWIIMSRHKCKIFGSSKHAARITFEYACAENFLVVHALRGRRRSLFNYFEVYCAGEMFGWQKCPLIFLSSSWQTEHTCTHSSWSDVILNASTMQLFVGILRPGVVCIVNSQRAFNAKNAPPEKFQIR